jgi:Ni,Fe-hydrogenase III small subunit
MRKDLSPGDCIVVRTATSVYQLRALSNGRFTVSGGWFDRKGLSPVDMSVSGCTWGGNAIMTGVVAACGLRIEFGNRLTTSPVCRVVVIPGALLN